MKRSRMGVAVRVFLIIFVIFGLQMSFKVFYGDGGSQSSGSVKPRAILYQWNHSLCGCPRYLELDPASGDVGGQRSMCGPAADVRGPNQRVLSYTFYGDITSVYFEGVPRNAKAIPNRYPGWTMRLYHDIAPSNREGTARLCDVICAHPVLDDCYVPDLEDRFAGLASKFQMVWRFVGMTDPLVDVFCSRDLDSTIHQREVDAVNDWLDSNRTWHLMRDHRNHQVKMLGGMWGVKNFHNRTKMAAIVDAILNATDSKDYGYDQALLARFAYPVASKSLMAHDSFQCKVHGNTIPFPTQRVNGTFVGDKVHLSIKWECPIECRPPDHQDWIYC